MGILDDAIREHLDLKRKHGAPEEELQRQEDEALGPARREVEPQATDAEGADGEAPVPAEDGPVADAGDSALFDGESASADAAPSDAPTEFIPPAEPEAPAWEPPEGEEAVGTEEAPRAPVEEEKPAPVADEPEVPAAPEPVAEAAPEASGDTPSEGLDALSSERHDHGATQEYDPFAQEPEQEDEPDEDAHDADSLFAEESEDDEDVPDDDGDVLEDTPDFLQETPEHDRLWFEQKPPRDFDFE